MTFEIDWCNDVAGWSVEVRGRLRPSPDRAAQNVDQLLLGTWTAELDHDVVELDPEVVSGSRFLLRSNTPDHGPRPTG